MLVFASNEQVWHTFFRRAWQIATTNGFEGRLTELFPGESAINLPENQYPWSKFINKRRTRVTIGPAFDELRAATVKALETKEADYVKKVKAYEAMMARKA